MNEDALKLTAYFGERDRTDRGLLADDLLEIYARHRLQVSVLLRGIEGFGREAQLQSDRLLSLSEDLPVVAAAVDRRERIEAALEEVLEIKRRGLITLERARLLSGAVGPSEPVVHAGDATKLTVYIGRRERVGGVPAFAAACELLHARGFSGAIALLAVDGTRHGARVRARFFSGNGGVPVMIIAIGSAVDVAGAVEALSSLLRSPLITIERVQVCKRDGRLLAEPHALPAGDREGRAMWQKLMVHTPENATHDGRPLHLELIRRLRAAEAAGATSVRGIWGFHGDHSPHGDRLLQIRRHVPVLTVAVDTPERTAHSFKIIDELTSGSGLVTSEMVPALAAPAAGGSRPLLHLAEHDY
jgi:PII-like signaling protein